MRLENFCRVSRGSLGIYLILKKFCIGDYVVVPWNICPDVIFAIKEADKIPYFVNYSSKNEPLTTQILTSIPAHITCLINVHVYGAFHKITNEMRNRFSLIIDDAAQAIGSKRGILNAGFSGNFGIFSFGNTKQYNLGAGGLIYAKEKNDAQVLEYESQKCDILSDEEYQEIRLKNARAIKSKLKLFEKKGMIDWRIHGLNSREIFKNYDEVFPKTELVNRLLTYNPKPRIKEALTFTEQLIGLNLQCDTLSPEDNVWRIVAKPIKFDFDLYITAFQHLRRKGYPCSNWYYPSNEIFGYKMNGNYKIKLDEICRFQFTIDSIDQGFSVLNKEEILSVMKKYYR